VNAAKGTEPFGLGWSGTNAGNNRKTGKITKGVVMWWLIMLMIATAAISYEAIVNVQSNEIRGWIGALIAAAFLLGLQQYIRSQANKRLAATGKKASLTFFDLIVTSEDNSYSLSRFQIYIWTGWVVIAFAQVAFATASFPGIPDNVAVLIGINGFTTVLSYAITDTTKLTPSAEPEFFRDIFLDSKGTLDLPRTQMFIWTLVILAIHIVIFFKSYHSPNPAIPDVPVGLLILMGVSNGAYLGTKAVAEKKS
jgi:hypothetical protein